MHPFGFGRGPFDDGNPLQPLTDAEFLAIEAERLAMRRAAIAWLGRNWPWLAVVALLAGVGLWLAG